MSDAEKRPKRTSSAFKIKLELLLSLNHCNTSWVKVKAKSKDSGSKGVSHEDLESFCLTENVNINLLKAKSKDFYWLIIQRRYNDQHSGPRRWNKTITEDKTNWKTIFRSVRKVCKENKLREFHFKFIHRVVVTKKELFRFNIKPDSNCVYCGESDSIDHTFIECQVTKDPITIANQNDYMKTAELFAQYI